VLIRLARLFGSRGKDAQREWLDRKQRNRVERDYRAFVGPAKLFDRVGKMQLDLLLHLGLSPDHVLLDVGCGAMRAGRFLVPFLAVGHYHGIEPEGWLVEEGLRHVLDKLAAEAKRPVFRFDRQFQLGAFGREFDFILAHSIFSHASPAQIEACLAEAAQVMKPTSMFVATFVPGTRDYEGGKWAHCAPYRLLSLMSVARRHGLSCEPIEWPHPTSQQWVLIRPQPLSRR